MYLFYLLLLLLPMLALHKRTEADGAILDAKSTTCIKGLLCFYVMFHNLGLDLYDNSPLKEVICEHTGGIGVGLFFFLSAFGIIRSYQAKGNGYLKKLLLVHIPKLYLISVGINLLTYFTFFRGQFETADLLMRIFNLDVFNDFNRMNRHGWYISTVIGMYLIFALIYYLCSRLKTDKKFIIAGGILAFIAVLFRVGAWIADNGGMYTREIPTFALGCSYATFYDKINEWANRYFKWGVLLCIPCIIFGLLVWEPLGSYMSAVLIILVSQRYTYYNPVSFFFGKICIGVYLFLHFSSIALQPYLHNEYWWVLLNAGFIIELAALLYAAELAITYAFRRIRGKTPALQNKYKRPRCFRSGDFLSFWLGIFPCIWGR